MIDLKHERENRMAMQVVRKGGTGRRGCTHPDWMEVPCVKIGKGTVTLNGAFVAAYLGIKRSLLILIDSETGEFGFKLPGPQDEDAYSVQKSASISKENSKSKLLYVKAGVIGKAFPSHMGKVFRCTMSNDRIIAADVEHPIGKG